MSRIFISYKRVDKNKVFKIKDQIESALGEKCWIDIDGIESDAQFVSVIVKAIDEADIVLFVYSGAHVKITDYEHDWTVRELAYASDEHKRIVFLNIDKSPLTGWFKFMYGQKQQVDATSLENIQHLIADLQHWLGISKTIKPQLATHNNHKEAGNKELRQPDAFSHPSLPKRVLCNPKLLIAVFVLTTLLVVICFVIPGLFLNSSKSTRTEQTDQLNTTIELAIPCIYDDATIFSEGLAFVRKGLDGAFIDTTGSVAFSLPCYYSEASCFDNGYAVAKSSSGEVCGVIDKTGKEKYKINEDIEWYDDTNGMFCVSRYNEKEEMCEYALVDTTGTFIVPYNKYDYMRPFSDGLVLVEKDELYGLLDKKGKLIIPCTYVYINDFYKGSAGYIEAGINGKCGLFDKACRKTDLPRYTFIGDFSEGLAKVHDRDKDKYGYIDETGKEIIPCIYDNVSDFTEGIAIVVKERKVGYIDKTGREIIPCIYENHSSFDLYYRFQEGLAGAQKDGKWGVIDKEGNEIAPFIYDGIIYVGYHEGYVGVRKDGKWGFIDKEGKEISSFIYDEIKYGFFEGFASVRQDDKWGYIDRLGKEVIPCQYEKAYEFKDGFARVCKDGKWGFLKIVKK